MARRGRLATCRERWRCSDPRKEVTPTMPTLHPNPRATAPHLARLWSTRPASRGELVRIYAGLVYKTRQRIVPHVPARVDVEDLESEGMIGLLDAVDRYDPERGSNFTTFAISMIRGSIYEWMRKTDWAPRSMRDAQKRLRAAESALGDSAADAEIAAYLGITLARLAVVRSLATEWRVVALEDVLWTDEIDDPDPIDINDALYSTAPGPEDRLLAADLRDTLAEAIGWLPVNERAVVLSYYYAEYTLQETGAALGRSESRAYQLKVQALGRLRGFLGEGVAL